MRFLEHCDSLVALRNNSNQNEKGELLARSYEHPFLCYLPAAFMLADMQQQNEQKYYSR
jgi:hypothetical protein